MFGHIAKLEPKKGAEKVIFNVENSSPHYFSIVLALVVLSFFGSTYLCGHLF